MLRAYTRLLIVVALALASQGVVQNLKPYATADLIEAYTTQVPKTDDKGQPASSPNPASLRRTNWPTIWKKWGRHSSSSANCCPPAQTFCLNPI